MVCYHIKSCKLVNMEIYGPGKNPSTSDFYDYFLLKERIMGIQMMIKCIIYICYLSFSSIYDLFRKRLD